MVIKRWLASLLAVLSCLVPAVAGAQTTGSISGVVFDQGGQLVQGATIRLTGDPLPGDRTAVTDANGSYNFPLLLTGTYTLEVSKQGVGTAKRVVVVQVDVDTQVDIVIGLNLDETVQVSAAAPVVDLKSTEVNFNYDAQLIKELPLQRTYAGLFQLIPGVAENNGFAPNGGASRQDNTYLIDGVNITNPGFGYLSTEVNEFDIAEFNVKRGAITAEFGRSSGFVTNAVTRSGTNRLSGGLRFEAIPSAWVNKVEATNAQATTDRWVPAYAIGGPVLRDRIFFYTSGQFARSSTTGRTNLVGAVPDSETSTNELFGKITAALAPSQFLNVGYRFRPSTTEFGGVGTSDSPEVATDSEGTNGVATAAWNQFFGQRNFVEVKYLRLKEENEAVARTDLGYQPTFDIANLRSLGYFTEPGTNFRYGAASLLLNRQNYKRDELRATAATYLSFGRTAHDLRVGFGYETTEEDLTRISNGWGSITLVESGTRYQALYYPTQPSQLSKSRTYGFFVQDSMQVGSRLVVNAGLLLNRDEFAQEIDSRNTFLTFDFGDQLQPRLGANYQLRKGKGDKVYGNYGRYYSTDQKSSARSLAPNRLVQNNAFFDARTGALISDTPGSNTTGKVLLDDMSPTYTDEVLFGYATPLLTSWGLDVFYMYRDANDFIEDYPRNLPASSFAVGNIAADRKYKAFTVELSRRMADRWSLTTSYSWSRLEGNIDFDYGGANTQVFNTSSIIQDGPGDFVEDDFRYGPLSQDRTHVLKVFGTYMVTDAFSLGTYIRAQSGSPWNDKAINWNNGYRLNLEPVGTNRNDFWTNVDLLAAYNLKIMDRFTTRLEARVLNLFNTQTALSVDDRPFLDPRTRLFDGTQVAGDPASYTRAMIINQKVPNGQYGRPTSYAAPRRFLLTARVDF